MLWHLVDSAGHILRSVDAHDKPTATERLGTGGFVISDASYRIKPPKQYVKVVVARAVRLPKIPDGHKYTNEAAASIALPPQRFREIAKLLGLVPGQFTKTPAARLRYYWSPAHIEAVATYHATQFSPARRRATQAKRRASYLATLAKRYAARIAARRLEWSSSRPSSRTASAASPASTSSDASTTLT